MRSEGGAGMSIRAEARAAVAQGTSRQGGDSMSDMWTLFSTDFPVKAPAGPTRVRTGLWRGMA